MTAYVCVLGLLTPARKVSRRHIFSGDNDEVWFQTFWGVMCSVLKHRLICFSLHHFP